MELGLLGLRRTRHPRELLVHAEVVLDRDRGQGLGLPPDLHPLLGLDGLVEPVAPPPSRHLPPGELVHDDDGAVVADDVALVLVEEGVRLEQLVDHMDPLRLVGVFGLQLGDPGPLLVDGEAFVFLDLSNDLREIGHDEGLGVARRQLVQTGVREVDILSLLVHGEEQHLVDFVETLLAHVVRLDLLHELHERGLVREQLHQALVLGASTLRRQQLLPGREFVFLGLQTRDRPRDEPVHHAALLAVQGAHRRCHLLERRRCVAADRPRDDQGRPRLVDQDGIDLVDDRVVVRALNPLLQRVHHVVAQVVEAELVVGPVGDVGVVRAPALLGSGLVEVDAVHREAEQLVDRAHPLGVALSQVRVHGDQVRAAARQCVQVEGHGGHEGLPLTRGHLPDTAAVQLHRPDELHVVRDHVPDERLPRDHDLLPAETPARLLHDCESLRQDLLQDFGQLTLVLLFELADPEAEGLPFLRVGEGAFSRPDGLDPGQRRLGVLGDPLLELVGPAPERLRGDRLQRGVVFVDLPDQRSQSPDFACVPGADDLLDDFLDHSAVRIPPGTEVSASSGFSARPPPCGRWA